MSEYLSKTLKIGDESDAEVEAILSGRTESRNYQQTNRCEDDSEYNKGVAVSGTGHKNKETDDNAQLMPINCNGLRRSAVVQYDVEKGSSEQRVIKKARRRNTAQKSKKSLSLVQIQ